MIPLRITVLFVLPVIVYLVNTGVLADQFCKVKTSLWNSNADVKFTVMLSLRKNYHNTCGVITPEALQLYVALKWAVEKVNAGNESFIPGVKLGLQLYDDCRTETFAARNALSLINPTLPTEITDCVSGNGTDTILNIGIIGPSRSSPATVVADLLRLTGIPIISPSATSATLSDKSLYPTFLRTAVSDTHQVEAIVQLLKKMHWNFIAVVYSADNYGRHGMDALKTRVGQEEICIAETLMIDTGINLQDILDRLKLLRFKAQDQTLAVVYFGQKDTADNLLFYADNILKGTWNLYWIMSDAVGQNVDVFTKKHERLVAGALTISPSKTKISEFLTFYFQHLKGVKTNTVQDASISEFLLQKTQSTLSPLVRHSDYVPLSLDAFYTLISAFKKAHAAICTTKTVCGRLVEKIQKGELLDYVKAIDVDYTQMDPVHVPATFREEKRRFSFSETGDIIRDADTETYTINSFNYNTQSFSAVGSFQGGVLQLDKSKIKMKNTLGQTTTGENLPKSACSGVCNKCIDSSKVPTIHLPGDVYIVGIFSLHNADPDARFGCDGFRNVSSDMIILEGFLHAVEVAKSQTGINFGAIVFDDCYNPLKIATTLSTYFSGFKAASDMFSFIVPWNKVVSVVGPLSSGVTIPTAEFFSQLNIPVVSYAASSVDLDDKTNFPYFLRTVPSDEEQSEAMVSVVQSMGWEYVDVLYVNNNYGTKGKDAFVRLASTAGICVGEPISINEINSDKAELYRTIIELQKRQAKIVVFYGIDTRYSDLMKVLNDRQNYGDFIFLASEEWGTKKQLLIDGGRAARGTLTLKLASPQVEDEEFVTYMLTRNLENTKNNPWFREFWQHLFKCNIKGSFRNVFPDLCPDALSLTEENLGGHLRDQRVAHVRSAVLAVTQAMVKTKKDICNDGLFPCQFYFNPKYSPAVLSNIRNTLLKAKGSDSNFRLFDDNGNGAIGFIIYSIQQEQTLMYKEVGYYNNRGLTLHKDRIRFYSELGDAMLTVDSTCELGKCDKCDRLISTATPKPTTPVASAHLDETFRVPDIVLVVLVGVIIIGLIIVIIITCHYFKKKVEGMSKHLQALEHQNLYEPIRDAGVMAYQNRQQFDRARYHPGQETIKFVNPSLNSLDSLRNVGINNQAFINDDHYLHANGSILSNLSPHQLNSLSPSKPDVAQPGLVNPRLSGLSSPNSLSRPTSSTIASPQYYDERMYLEDPNRHGTPIGTQARAFHLPIQVPYTPSSQHQVSPEEPIEYSDVVTPNEPSEYLQYSPQHQQQNPPQTLYSPSHSEQGSQTQGTPYELSPTSSLQSASSLSGQSHRISPTDSDPQMILRQRNIERIPKPVRQNHIAPPVPQKVPGQLPALNRNIPTPDNIPPRSIAEHISPRSTPEHTPMNDVNSPVLSRRPATASPGLGRNIGPPVISTISTGVPSHSLSSHPLGLPSYTQSSHSQDSVDNTSNIELESPQYSDNTMNSQGSLEARISRV